jgi:hypothetical protein
MQTKILLIALQLLVSLSLVYGAIFFRFAGARVTENESKRRR